MRTLLAIVLYIWLHKVIYKTTKAAEGSEIKFSDNQSLWIVPGESSI